MKIKRLIYKIIIIENNITKYFINNNLNANVIITTNEKLNYYNITGNNVSNYLYNKYTYKIKKEKIDKNYIENSDYNI